MSGMDPIPEDELIRFHAGDLSVAERAALMLRLQSDPEARALLAEWDRQDADLGAAFSGVLGDPLPEGMLRSLSEARAEDRLGARERLALPLRVAAALALLFLGAAGGFFAGRVQPQGSGDARFAENALTAYTTYVSEVAHPVEVEAAEAAHLVQWLSKRLGHPINAPDFAAAGFRLIGGRLLPSETGPAAMFMYEDTAGHRVTLYAAPGKGTGDTAFRFIERGSAQGFYWIDGALSYAVAGEIPRETLRAIAVAAYDQLI